MSKRLNFKKPLLWMGLSSLILIADQVSKAIAIDMLSFSPMQLLPFLSLTLACNTGAAFSILEGQSEILAVVGILFALFFAYLIIRLPKDHRLEGFAFSLILAGALGNVIDRVVHGCVVDFIHVHWGAWNFPIFNFADSAITIGAGLWIISLLRNRTAPQSNQAEEVSRKAD